MPVPARGWPYPVRVCDSCKDILLKKHDACPGIEFTFTLGVQKIQLT